MRTEDLFNMENIEGKTIFDFCKDEVLLKEIIGAGITRDYYEDFHPAVHYSHLQEYAVRINDVKLFDAATQALNKAESDFRELQRNGLSDGMIIDY